MVFDSFIHEHAHTQHSWLSDCLSE